MINSNICKSIYFPQYLLHSLFNNSVIPTLISLMHTYMYSICIYYQFFIHIMDNDDVVTFVFKSLFHFIRWETCSMILWVLCINIKRTKQIAILRPFLKSVWWSKALILLVFMVPSNNTPLQVNYSSLRWHSLYTRGTTNSDWNITRCGIVCINLM